MTDLGHSAKLHFRRIVRRRRKKVEELGLQADANIEKLLLRRLDRLISVRRFVILWISLLAAVTLTGILQFRSLGSYYLLLQPVPGGVYSEGLVGTISNVSPLYATGASDSAISHLVFSGLFRYDQKNKLVGDLAEKYQIDAKESRYVVTLRKDVLWHDGKPFTADDVLFTYQTIQNSDAKSSLYSNWQGIKVSKQNDYIVSFDLPNALSSFPYALTNGIVPKHLLKNVPVVQMRSAQFNTSPIGTGPFKWKSVEVSGNTNSTRRQRATLTANTNYHLGKPKLDGFTIVTFRDEQQLLDSFKKKEIVGISGLSKRPTGIPITDYYEYNVPLTDAVMAFYNNSRAPLNDLNVRKALTMAVDQKELVTKLDKPAQMITGPLLPGQPGFDKTLNQPSYNVSEANRLLDVAGWKMGANGIRTKGGVPLRIKVYSQNTPEYMTSTHLLQTYWQKVGVSVQDPSHLAGEDLQSAIIASHDYDVLLYGISIGVDPDVYAYWHSSQASISSQGHLNLSEYQSKIVDQYLEAGRIRSDVNQRAAKYRSFINTWINDVPALSLYRPSYLYISRKPIASFGGSSFNSGIDRFNNVHNWMIREEKRSP